MGEVDCGRVNKLDCIGHVQKRMGKNLIEMTKKSKNLLMERLLVVELVVH